MFAADLTTERVLNDALARQRTAYFAAPIPPLEARRRDLKALQRFLRENKTALCDAVNADYGHRAAQETLLLEIFPAVDAIDHALTHLFEWSREQTRAIDLRVFFGASNRVIPQPLGVVGVIVPWNFPINLSFLPLTYILAAGNRAMVKMSENSRHLTRFIIEKLPNYLSSERVQFFEETGGVGIEFSKLKFDHLLFTGSGQTGRAVMTAAAQNLVPVTLELGGKSPAIVFDDYSLQKAAERILYVKLLNAGQICTTVDHLWLPRGKAQAFIEIAQQLVPQRYPNLNCPDYTAIIDDRAYARLTNALEQARAGGATLIPLLEDHPHAVRARKLNPTLVLNAPANSELHTREIFGPILPIYEYDSIDAVIDTINANPRPLAVYPFSNRSADIDNVLTRVMSGGVSVNDALFHVGQHDLPFGGVGDSGMGHYHGREGFETFSKMRPIFYQARVSGLKLMAPPYGKLVDAMVKFLVR